MNSFKSNSKVVNAWCMYDWANSVYSLVITTAIFPLYYNAVTTTSDNNYIVSFFGFEIVIESIEAKFKSSQNKFKADREGVRTGLDMQKCGAPPMY